MFIRIFDFARDFTCNYDLLGNTVKVQLGRYFLRLYLAFRNVSRELLLTSKLIVSMRCDLGRLVDRTRQTRLREKYAVLHRWRQTSDYRPVETGVVNRIRDDNNVSRVKRPSKGREAWHG